LLGPLNFGHCKLSAMRFKYWSSPVLLGDGPQKWNSSRRIMMRKATPPKRKIPKQAIMCMTYPLLNRTLRAVYDRGVAEAIRKNLIMRGENS
jgi:hypothetical protein